MVNPEWFGGNQDGVEIFNHLVKLGHTWDDIVDGDPVTKHQVSEAFGIALIGLPANRLYQQLLPSMLPMWAAVISAYETANHYEETKDPHGIEIGHVLRYMAGILISHVVIACVGYEKSREVMPEVWKAIVFERFDEYRKEHLDA